jgi:hypothetical protein
MHRVLLWPCCDHTQGHPGDRTPTSILFLVWISRTLEAVRKFRRIVALVVAGGHIRFLRRPRKPTQPHNRPARSPADDQRYQAGRKTACCMPRGGLNPENGDTMFFRNTDTHLPDYKTQISHGISQFERRHLDRPRILRSNKLVTRDEKFVRVWYNCISVKWDACHVIWETNRS